MIASLRAEVASHGDQMAVVPIRRLEELRQDVKNLKDSADLNNFQKFIVDTIYQLDVPEGDFPIRSIIIVASPSPSTVRLTFVRDGKTFPVMIPVSYVDKDRSPVRIENYLKTFHHARGSHVCYAPRLPRKLLAVRSGLGEYGRNNICYVEGMGSFLNLNPYFSDIPCAEDRWQDMCQMEACHTCRLCLQNCPTAAILPTRFLIDNERCLTYFNEAGGEWNFPDWIDPAWHNALYGCLRCQAVCPKNKPFLNTRVEQIDFTEAETAYLWEGKSPELFPEELKQKAAALAMEEYLGVLPRNLRVLFPQYGVE